MTETQEIQLFKFDAEFAFEQPLDDLVLVMTMTSKMGRPIRQPIPMLGKIPSLEVAWKKAMPYIQKWIMGANSTGNVEVIYDELELQAKLSQAIDKIDIVAFERKREEQKKIREKLEEENKKAKQAEREKAQLEKLENQKEKFSPDVIEEAKRIVEEGRLMEFFVKTVSKYHFGDDNVKKHSLTSHVSKFMPGEKLKHNASTGESSGGKSSCMFKSLFALPRHQRLYFGSVSEKSLYYYCRDDPAALKWKTVYIDEVNPKLYDALKSLTNPDGIETPWLTVDDGHAVNLNPEKPFNLWVSSVQTFTETEIRNRFDYPEGDDDKAKKEAVDLEIIRHKARNDLWSQDKLEKDRDYKVCRAAIQYLTETKKVNGCIIPDEFIDEIAEIVFQSNRNDKIGFMALCNDIAYINVCKRQLTPNKEIIVQREDIEEAKAMWGSTSAKLSATERNILKLFEMESEQIDDEWVNFSEMKKRDIEKWLMQFYQKTVSSSTVQRSLDSLIDKGFLDKHGGGQGVAATYTLAGIRNTKSEGVATTLKSFIGAHLKYNPNHYASVRAGAPTQQDIDDITGYAQTFGLKCDTSKEAAHKAILEYCAPLKAKFEKECIDKGICPKCQQLIPQCQCSFVGRPPWDTS